MITRFEAQNYGCLKDVKVDLTPLHAFIGPNDSGKSTLRASAGTQVILATHSPLVINELKPEEVTVVTRPSIEEGTVVTPIAKTPNFAKRSEVYALGELWVSYADGRLEEPLLSGGPANGSP